MVAVRYRALREEPRISHVTSLQAPSLLEAGQKLSTDVKGFKYCFVAKVRGHFIRHADPELT